MFNLLRFKDKIGERLGVQRVGERVGEVDAEKQRHGESGERARQTDNISLDI